MQCRFQTVVFNVSSFVGNPASRDFILSLLDSQRYHVNLGLFSDQGSTFWLFLTDLRSYAAEKIKEIVMRIKHYERLKRRYLYYYYSTKGLENNDAKSSNSLYTEIHLKLHFHYSLPFFQLNIINRDCTVLQKSMILFPGHHELWFGRKCKI